eukprot:m.67014 g.67014  ORF g.67014 m.67014 type:complete len:124 (-) comp8404_c0_seq1:468-839(-)
MEQAPATQELTVLSCYSCSNSMGHHVKSSIDTAECDGMDIGNSDGVLTCGEVTGRTGDEDETVNDPELTPEERDRREMERSERELDTGVVRDKKVVDGDDDQDMMGSEEADMHTMQGRSGGDL